MAAKSGSKHKLPDKEPENLATKKIRALSGAAAAALMGEATASGSAGAPATSTAADETHGEDEKRIDGMMPYHQGHVVRGLDAVLDGKQTFYQMFSDPAVATELRNCRVYTFANALPYNSARLAVDPKRLNFSNGGFEDCSSQFLAAEDLVRRVLVPEMIKWTEAKVLDGAALDKLRCGFQIANWFHAAHYTVPVTQMLAYRRFVNGVKIAIRYYRTPGYAFPAVASVLKCILGTKELHAVHTACVESLGSGMSWFLSQERRLVIPEVLECLRAVRESSADTDEIERFQKPLLYYLPRADKDECMRVGLLKPANGKVLNPSMQCINKHGGPVVADTIGELCDKVTARKGLHDAHTCTCYCSCAKCWDTLCIDSFF